MKRPSLPTSILTGTLLAGMAVVAHDAVVPIPREISTRFAIASIESYRSLVSPRLQRIVRCRYQPTCSLYGLEAVKKYGAVKGGWRAAKRIARCRPGVPMGTVDPP